MANKRPKPEEIVTKLRQVEVVPGGGIEPPTRGFSMKVLIYFSYITNI